MNEYVLFNLIVLFGPFALSFDKRVNFRQYWGLLLKSMWLPVVIFLIWDVLVSNRHWWFNEAFAGSFNLLGLPPGEWLFFFTVPYACLFSWEVLHEYFKDKKLFDSFPSFGVGIALFAISFVFFLLGFEYTGLAIASLSAALIADSTYKTDFFLKRHTWINIGLIVFLTLIFNGYLTARPVVQYDYSYQLNWLIYTIPVEDFIYGLALLLWILVRYESKRNRVF